MSNKLKLLIDARKIGDAGIGTYLSQLVPRVMERFAQESCRLWVSEPGLSWFAGLQHRWGDRIQGELLPARPLSLGEQRVLRQHLGPDTLLWATSLSHPLFYSGPMVATVHDVAQLALPMAMAGGRFTQLAAKVYLESLRRSAQELLFISQFTQSEFSHWVGSPRQPVTVTPLGVDAAWFDARGAGPRPQAQPYFISVSSVRPHKNFGFLVRAFAAVADRLPHQLVIVGESQGLRTVDAGLAAQVEALGGRVRFLGRIPDADLRSWVAHADAMVFPSLYEGFGLPPVEAMAAGCPVLSSTAGALQEVCGEAALYFNPQDLPSLQSALLAYAASSPEQRQTRVALGLSRARQYDWERTADATAAVLLRACAARR